jgi:two-component system chemotaxis response regulator CheB
LGVDGVGFQQTADSILTQFFIMSQVKVVRQWGNAVRASSLLPPANLPRLRDANKVSSGALAIGCSTGGPSALSVLLRDLPRDFAWPILLVQHMPPSFIPNFASWIASLCSFPVNLVTDPQLLRPGHLYMAAGDHHLEIRGGCAMSSREAPVTGQRPSATYLFRSVMREFGSSAVGVLLTGMGEDGAEGLLDMRRAGARTIVENETTAVVYGMPAAAVAIGAAAESLPLQQIAPRIAELFSRSPEETEWPNKVTY